MCMFISKYIHILKIHFKKLCCPGTAFAILCSIWIVFISTRGIG